MSYGGAERQLALLATGLRKVGHEVSVFPFYPGGEFEDELRANGVKVKSLEKKGRWDNVGFLLRTFKALKGERTDIVHGYMGGANILSAMLKGLIRPSKTVWGIRGSGEDIVDYGWLHSASIHVETKLARLPDLIICNSQVGRAVALQKGYPRDRTVVVPNGVDVDRFFIDNDSRSKIRKEWGVSDDHIVLGRVGRLDPVKDYPCFLRAAAILAAARPDIKFVCVGTGKEAYSNELRSLASSLCISDRVFWTGAIHNMRRAYSGFDLLVSSSISEAFPNVLMEAMACGVPCVATDVGDAVDILDGSGRIVQPSDPPSLANACLDLLNSPPKPYQVRDRVLARYNSELLVERSLTLFGRILPPTKAARTQPVQ